AFRAGIRSGGIAISRLAAHNRGLKAGDTTTLPTPGGAHRFRISSVFDDFAGEETMYVDRDSYIDLWGDRGSFRFAIVPDPAVDTTMLKARLADAVSSAHIPAEVQSRADAVGQLTSGLTQLFSIARAIQLAALVVAAFSLASTAFTVVLERRWAFGLQRTLGMSRR